MGFECFVRSPRNQHLTRLVPATGIFALPFRGWCPLRVYALSPSAIGAPQEAAPLAEASVSPSAPPGELFPPFPPAVMGLGVVKERAAGEKRVAVTPKHVRPPH
eukprot:631406-Prorocentrum_minimum.AAC.1